MPSRRGVYSDHTRKASTLIATIAALVLAGPTRAELGMPLVKLESGVVSGLELGTVRGNAQAGINAFLVLPYAKAPLGDRRWRAPEPVTPWAGTRDATRISPACVQDPPKPFGPYTAEFLTLPEMSEDCLYLNVWTPQARGAKTPVYVFIHGGAFQSGSTSVAVYDGADLARQGVVVVTLNYRLGVLGFFAHPELNKNTPIDASGNFGLLDIIAALRWVKSNIAQFGGDPEDVTVAGQSAGAIAVNDLLVSPLAKGLFQRAVAESGPTMGIKPVAIASAVQGGSRLAAAAKVGSLAELRGLPVEQLFAASKGSGHSGPPYFPLPFLDGAVVANDPEVATNPIASPVPLLVGFNREEQIAPAMDAAQFEAKVRLDYGAFADRVLAAYPHANDVDAQRSAVALVQDRQIANLEHWAERRERSSGQRVFVYLFDHPYPGANPAQFKTFHTAEVPYVFGNLGFAAATSVDRAVAEQMQARWVAFMRRGDPSVPGAPWLDAGLSKGRVMRLGDVVGQSEPISDPARQAVMRDFLASTDRP